MEFITKSNLETIDLGRKIGANLKGGELILLVGDLGGGKTQFTKGIAKGLEIKDEIVSPTFTIERIYESKQQGLTLHHFDFYRLSRNDQEMIEEVEDLLRDSKNILVMEWPQNLKENYPDQAITFEFEYLSENERKITLRFGKNQQYIVEAL